MDVCGKVFLNIFLAVKRYLGGFGKGRQGEFYRYQILQDEKVGCGMVVLLGKEGLRLDLSTRGLVSSLRGTENK
jgi:hypothetical protein